MIMVSSGIWLDDQQLAVTLGNGWYSPYTDKVLFMRSRRTFNLLPCLMLAARDLGMPWMEVL